MEKIIVKAADKLHIVPQRNNTYALEYSQRTPSMIVQKQALIEMIDKAKRICDDLISQAREDTPVYWWDPQITSRKKQADELVYSPRVLCIRNDRFEVILEIGAFHLLCCLTKIIWKQDAVERMLKNGVVRLQISKKKSLIIKKNEHTFDLVHENHNSYGRTPETVSFPLHVLAYLCSIFRAVISDFQHPELGSTLYWGDGANEVKMIWWDKGKCNILKFGNRKTRENIYQYFVAIRESTFTDMYKLTMSVDQLPDDASVSSLTHHLSTGKSINFSPDGQEFMTLNGRFECDTLPTTALDELLKKRDEITEHFHTESGGDVQDDGTIYWENDDYTIQAGHFVNESRGINSRVLRFNRKKDSLLKNKWFFVITEETLTKLLDLYQQEKKTKISD